MTKAYEQGFMDKCAELGVDPGQLVKAAGGNIFGATIDAIRRAQRMARASRAARSMGAPVPAYILRRGTVANPESFWDQLPAAMARNFDAWSLRRARGRLRGALSDAQALPQGLRPRGYVNPLVSERDFNPGAARRYGSEALADRFGRLDMLDQLRVAGELRDAGYRWPASRLSSIVYGDTDTGLGEVFANMARHEPVERSAARVARRALRSRMENMHLDPGYALKSDFYYTPETIFG